MTRSHETKRTLRLNPISGNGAKVLTVREIRRILQKTMPGHRILIAARPAAPDDLYPKGINGGHIIYLLVRDGRAGRANQIVALEMKWIAGTGWYPLKRELTTAEAAGVCNVALTTFYRISADLESKKKVFGLSFFDTQTLFSEMALVDELAERVDAKRGKVRPGAHADHCPDPAHGPGACPHADHCRAHASHRGVCADAHTSYCLDAEHDGVCEHATYCKANPNHPGTCKDANDPRLGRRRSAASSGWTKEPRRPRAYKNCPPDPTPEPELLPAEPEPAAQRQTISEAAINEATPNDPAARAALYEEQRAEIDAERRAGNFAPKGEEIL